MSDVSPLSGQTGHRADIAEWPSATPSVFGGIHATCLSALVTDPAMEAWYHPSIASMTPNRRVRWQATSDDENS
jgi:hypothetical protein